MPPNAGESASERVTTLMTPSEKARLESKARDLGVSVGEYVRRSVDGYDPDGAAELGQLAALSAELERSHREAVEALDRALAALDATFAQLGRAA